MHAPTVVLVLFVGFASACMPRSSAPLPSAGVDERLVGVWLAEVDGERVEATVTRAEERLHVVTVATDVDDAEDEPERMVFEATSSAIGGSDYLSFRVIEWTDDDDVSLEGFYFCLYELAPADSLAVRCLATDPVVADVEAGLVAGTVERGEYVTEVTLTADGAALAAYLAAADPERLFFTDQPLSFRRGP